MKKTINAGACSAAIVLALFAGVAAADEPVAGEKPAVADEPATVSDAQSGFRAYIDPTTGKLRQATAAERAAEARAFAAERKAHPKRMPTVVKRADGILQAVDTDGYFAEDVIATVGPDGKLIYSYESEGQPITHAAPAALPEEK